MKPAWFVREVLQYGDGAEVLRPSLPTDCGWLNALAFRGPSRIGS